MAFHPIRKIKIFNYLLSTRKDVDFYLVTLQQSGTHWMNFLICKALSDYYNLEYQFDSFGNQGIIEQYGAPFKYSHRPEIPRVQQFHYRYVFLFKSKKAILVIRDLRDTVVSQYEKYRKVINPNISFSEFLRKQTTEEKMGHSLKARINFLNSWWQNKNKLRDLLVIQYEHLLRDTEVEMKKVLDFMGIFDVDENFIRNVVRFSSIENMRTLQNKANFQRKEKDYSINKGKTGRYRDYFSSKDLDWFKRFISKNLVNSFGYNYLEDEK